MVASRADLRATGPRVERVISPLDLRIFGQLTSATLKTNQQLYPARKLSTGTGIVTGDRRPRTHSGGDLCLKTDKRP